MTQESALIARLRTLIEDASKPTWAPLGDVIPAHHLDAGYFDAFWKAVDQNNKYKALIQLNQFLKDEDNISGVKNLHALDIDLRPASTSVIFVLFNQDLVPDLKDKHKQITKILQYIHNGQKYNAAQNYLLLRKNGYDWPELSLIDKKLRALHVFRHNDY